MESIFNVMKWSPEVQIILVKTSKWSGVKTEVVILISKYHNTSSEKCYSQCHQQPYLCILNIYKTI